MAPILQKYQKIHGCYRDGKGDRGAPSCVTILDTSDVTALSPSHIPRRLLTINPRDHGHRLGGKNVRVDNQSSKKLKADKKVTKKRILIDLDTSSDEEKSNLLPDLTLTLAQPSTKKKHDLRMESATSSSPSQYSCMSMETKPNHAWRNNEAPGEPMLVCMGCRDCQLYVMVSNTDPKCPNCRKSNYLLDISCGNLTKKTRAY